MLSGKTAWKYATRTVPAWSVLLTVSILIFSFLIHPYGKGDPGNRDGSATTWQLVLSAYTVFLHICSVMFPARVCFAIGDVTRRMKETATVKDIPRKRRMQTITTADGTKTCPTPLFVILLPAYKEEMATLEETLRVLASHPQAKHSYHIYLAMEEKEEKSDVKATILINSFEKSFYRMSYTVHPQGLDGEAQGKSSNESWAAKQACRDYSKPAIKPNVIFTTMDADTHLSPRYFAQLARSHLECPDTNQTRIYVPPIVFDRNLHHVPLPVRTADLMWAGAGISSLYTGSNVCIPTSVYSLPMTLVELVGGWDTDPGAIGEDMHMYLKCFFALSGNIDVQIIYAAASQCNVSSDVPGIRGYIDGLNARYKQALRHMWGSLDTGYAIRQSWAMMDRHRQANMARVDLPLSAPNSNWTAFYTSTGLHKTLSTSRFPEPELATIKPIHWSNVCTLSMRMFEAHFLPIHLAVILTASSIFTLFYPSFLIPEVLKMALDFSGWCRLAGWLLMLTYFWRYETYHRLCVSLRQEEMRRAGMLEHMEENDGFSHRVFQVVGFMEAGLFPLGGFIFGAIPAVQAVLSHIFTDRLVYVVSLKPQLAVKRLAGMGT